MMKILWIKPARRMAGAAFIATLGMAGAPAYGEDSGGAVHSTTNGLPAQGSSKDARIADGTDGAASAAGKCNCAADTYAIINLVPGIGYRTRLNTRGHAAFEYVSATDRLRVGFFDGERVSDITLSALEGASLGDMNALSEVTMYGTLRSGTGFNLRPLRWSRAAGWTTLPVLSSNWDTFTGAINDHGMIVGASGIGPGEAGFRAVRWGATNSLLQLPAPPGFGESIANEINEHGVSVGYAYNPAGVTHALLWDGMGRPTDLGTLGASEAAALVNNNRGEIAGWLDLSGPDFQSFLWSPGKGVTRVGLNTVPGDLNNAGELVGRIYYPDTGVDHAFIFSRTRGLVDLHRPPFTSSDASQVNDQGTVVGEMFSNLPGPLAQRAYRWTRTGQAVDLNARLLDVPDGLVVTQALRISSSGDIIANSNAGLVLLRRAGGTNAPVLGPIAIPAVVRPDEPVALTLSFRDRNKADSHSATVDWGDGSGAQAASLSERNGRGALSAVHTYRSPGDYYVLVRVTDSTDRVTSQAHRIIIYPPWMQGIVGEGNLRAAGARRMQPTLAFRLAAPTSPTHGKTLPFSFVLQGKVAFKGERLERVGRIGNTISLEGRGSLDGRPGYRFRIEARDGQQAGTMEADQMSVKIERADPGASPAAGSRQTLLNYGVTNRAADTGLSAREGTLPPNALRLID